MENNLLDSALSSPQTAVETTLATTDRPFMSTPIDEYSVTEGLLLLLVLLLVLGWLWKQIKEVF